MPDTDKIKKQRFRLYAMALDDNHCPWCERKMLLNRPEGMSNTKWYKVMATVDHIQAKADGGSNDMDNMVLTCSNCNSKKGSHQEKINNMLQVKIGGMLKYVGFDICANHCRGQKGMALKEMIAWAQAFGIEV